MQSNTGGGWSSWGTSIWGTARSSVSAFTTQLGTGIHTVVETVESALEVPPPEEMAETHAAAGGDEAEAKEKAEAQEKTEVHEEETEGKTKEDASEGSWWGVTSSMMSTAQKTVS